MFFNELHSNTSALLAARCQKADVLQCKASVTIRRCYNSTFTLIAKVCLVIRIVLYVVSAFQVLSHRCS